MGNYITVSSGNRSTNIQIKSKHHFFNKKEIHYEYKSDCLIFREPNIDDNKHIIKPQLDKKNNFYSFYMTLPPSIELEKRRYEIDDDYMTNYELSVYCL